MDTLGRITQLCKERGWSRYRLAKEANISHTTLRNLYNRNTIPSIPTLEAICAGLGVSLSQFFAEGDDAVALNDNQKEMLAMWSTLAEDQKTVLLELIRKM
jgi:transcriptional regulator with XRE-family HTH domain